MANPSIDSITFESMTGQPLHAPAHVVEDVSPPGQSGHVFRRGPSRSAPVQVRTLKTYTTAALLQQALQDYADVKGTKVTVVDQLATSWSNVMVLDVRPMTQRLAAAIVGATGLYLLEAVWELQTTEVIPEP